MWFRQTRGYPQLMAVWEDGERLVRMAERLVDRAPRLKTRELPEDWARRDAGVMRAMDHRDLQALMTALLTAMLRLPLLSETRAHLMLQWMVRQPVAVDRLKRNAERAGIGWRTVERAKQAEGLKAIRKNHHWYWQRP